MERTMKIISKLKKELEDAKTNLEQKMQIQDQKRKMSMEANSVEKILDLDDNTLMDYIKLANEGEPINKDGLIYMKFVYKNLEKFNSDLGQSKMHLKQDFINLCNSIISFANSIDVSFEKDYIEKMIELINKLLSTINDFGFEGEFEDLINYKELFENLSLSDEEKKLILTKMLEADLSKNIDRLKQENEKIINQQAEALDENYSKLLGESPSPEKEKTSEEGVKEEVTLQRNLPEEILFKIGKKVEIEKIINEKPRTNQFSSQIDSIIQGRNNLNTILYTLPTDLIDTFKLELLRYYLEEIDSVIKILMKKNSEEYDEIFYEFYDRIIELSSDYMDETIDNVPEEMPVDSEENNIYFIDDVKKDLMKISEEEYYIINNIIKKIMNNQVQRDIKLFDVDFLKLSNYCKQNYSITFKKVDNNYIIISITQMTKIKKFAVNLNNLDINYIQEYIEKIKTDEKFREHEDEKSKEILKSLSGDSKGAK